MDIITNKSAIAPQAPNQNIRQSEAVSAGRMERDKNLSTVQLLQSQESIEHDKETLEEAVAGMQEATQAMQRNLNFSIDDSTGRMVVKVTDSSSGEVIRQMPSEEALRLAESLDEMRSLLFEAQA